MKQLYLKTLVLLLMCMVGCSAMAYDCEVDGIYYDLDQEEMTAKVTKGTSNSYAGEIVIPSTITYAEQIYSVTNIGSSAFSGCSNLTSVTIPNSVTKIGKSAFMSCRGLTSITIPNSVTDIKEGAFYGCSGLTSVTIGNSVTSIGESVFSDCSGLTSFTIPNSVIRIGQSAFKGCTGLTSITIPNSVFIIEERAFQGCTGLISVTIPNNLSIIGSYIFMDCKNLSSPVYNKIFFFYMPTSYSGAYTIPDGIKYIIGGAFSGCTDLTSVTIPNSVTSIGGDAFRDCSGLTSITIPNSVTSIGYKAFTGCSGLTSVISLATTPPTCGSNVFEGVDKQACKLIVPTGSKEVYENANQWKDFSLIKEGAETMSVATAKAGSRSTHSIHLLDGKRIDSKQKGLNIIRRNDGTVKKVMVK